MNLKDRQLKNYYRNISTLLPCPGGMKRNLLSGLKTQIAAYLEENPNADMETVQDRFGTPQQIVGAALEEMPTPEVLRKIHIRKRILLILGAALLAALLIWLGAAVVAVILDYGRGGVVIEAGPAVIVD